MKKQQRCLIWEEVKNSPKEFGRFLDTLHEFFEALDQASKISKIPQLNPKNEMDLQSQKAISFPIAEEITLIIQTEKFVYHSVLKTTFYASPPWKKLNYMLKIHSHRNCQT